MKQYIYIVLCLLLAACSRQPEITLSVSKCAPMPDGGRASASACALNGKGYVLAGRDSAGTYLKDLWQYDPSTDTWTNLGEAPFKARVNAVITAYNNKLYAGLGYSALRAYNDKHYRHDWWEYTPVTGKWQRLADYPSDNTVSACAFTLDEIIYILYGCGHVQQNEVWQYDPASDQWTQLPEAPDPARRAFGTAGAVVDGMIYFGTGFNGDNLTKWHQFSPSENRWHTLAYVPGKGRVFSACASTSKYVYLFGGRHFSGDMTGGEVFETYLRYAPATNSWEWCGKMPQGRRENMIAFTINGKAYFGLGEDADGQVSNQLYYVEE